LTLDEIQKEIDLGFFRPSLIRDLKYGKFIPEFWQASWQKSNELLDKTSNFKPHKEVYELKRQREEAFKLHQQLSNKK
jgi:hypothetical protein